MINVVLHIYKNNDTKMLHKQVCYLCDKDKKSESSIITWIIQNFMLFLQIICSIHIVMFIL